MIQITNKADCCGCSACLNACPKNCISMEADSEGFLYPSVDTTQCIHCGLCEKVCSFNNELPLRERKPETYAAKIKDDAIRNSSSSGGIFSALADKIFEDDGVVYGVSMNEDMKSARHIRVDKKENFSQLRGSKYLQSSLGNTYRQVKDDLEHGKYVLFSGVPCQIDGLKLFLRKEYENLLTVEVICHGVPSPSLWKKYCEHLENKFSAKIESVNFREKRNGWKKFGLVEEGENISQYLGLGQDPYMQMFLRNYCLRPSCYQCKAKKFESMADITIADFWGINKVLPKMDDDKGTSLVLIQTAKGEKIFGNIGKNCIVCKTDYEQSIRENPAYYKSVERPEERDCFFNDMNSMDFEGLQKKYCKKVKVNFFVRLFRLGKRILKRILRGGVSKSYFEYGLRVVLKKKK